MPAMDVQRCEAPYTPSMDVPRHGTDDARRRLPVKVFNMFDVNRDGTLSKDETLHALRKMGVGQYNTTVQKRKRFEAIWEQTDVNKTGEIELGEFRLLLKRLMPDEDQLEILVQVFTYQRIAMISVLLFLAFVACSTGGFMLIKRDEGGPRSTPSTSRSSRSSPSG